VETIKKVYEKYGYILDPHGAVGFRSAELYLNKENSSDNLVVVLETAHASKFNDVLKEKTGLEANEPESFKFYDGRQKQSIKFPYSFQNLKEFLLSDEI
jgi:threonine synthase